MTANRINLVTLAFVSGLLATIDQSGSSAQSISTDNDSFYRGPIVDAHAHIGGVLNLDSMVKSVRRAGVTKIVIWPHNRPFKDRDIKNLRKRHGDLIVPTVGFVKGGWRKQRPNFVDRALRRAGSGDFVWLGEVAFRGKLRSPLLVDPASSSQFVRILKFATGKRFPVSVHHANIVTEETEALLQKIERHSRAPVIWAHWCGTSKAESVRVWLKRIPNLYCDLAWHHVPSSLLPVPIRDDYFRFLPHWKELMEVFPDRFLLGTDAKNDDDYGDYDNRIYLFRRALGELKPETARKIAQGNFETIRNFAAQ